MSLHLRSEPRYVRINPFTGGPDRPFLAKLSDGILNLSASGAWAISVSALLLLMALDLSTAFRWDFLRFALIPIALLTWARGRSAGLVIAFVAGTAWISTGLLQARAEDADVVVYWNSAVRLSLYVLSALVLSALRGSLQEEMRLARTDFLTGVANRRFFMEIASHEIRRARRYQRPFIVSYADIDGFKLINDRFGHNQGDALLRLVAQTIRAHLREVDVVARLGGDEFALLLPETGGHAAREVMTKIQRGLARAMRANAWPVTFSIGTVVFNSPPVSVDEMVKRADDLMYRVKRSGKNTVDFETWDVRASGASSGH